MQNIVNELNDMTNYVRYFLSYCLIITQQKLIIFLYQPVYPFRCIFATH